MHSMEKTVQLQEWRYSLLPPQLKVFEDDNRLAIEKKNNIHKEFFRDNQVVARDTRSLKEKNKCFKSFMDFKNYEDVYEMIESTLPKSRHFYEVIMALKRQKPYFDIDINAKKDEDGKIILPIVFPIDAGSFMDNFLTTIRKVIKSSGRFLNITNDLLVYSSHSSIKKSFHVVIRNYFFENYRENKLFYNMILNNISSEHRKYVDDIYNPNRQFRLLNCKKIGSERVKIRDESICLGGISYDVCKYSKLDEFLNSIVGHIGVDCEYLKLFESVQRNVCSAPKNRSEKDYSTFLIKFLELKYPDNNFKIDKIINYIIYILSAKLHGYHCGACDREHEHENPYVIFIKKENAFYFCCRRLEEKQLLVGL